MKKTIVLTVALMIIGLAYAGWWQQTVREMALASMEGGGALHDWGTFRARFPRFAITARLMGLDLFSESEAASRDAMRMMQQLYRSAGVHSVAGLLVAALAGGFLGGFACGRRHKRREHSEPGVGR